MKNIVLSFLTILSAVMAWGQSTYPPHDLSCGTKVRPQDAPLMQDLYNRWRHPALFHTANKAVYGGSTFFVPVQIHIIRETGGTGGFSVTETEAAFARLNEYYIDASIQFYQCAPINYIDNTTYYNYAFTTFANDVTFNTTYGTTNVINLYIANSVTSGANSLCGYAYFPVSLDMIMMSSNCMSNGSTLAHEFGHYFGLYHTHETTFGNELVDGSNCTIAGDRLCDTEADPQIGAGNINSGGCTYIGGGTDANGDAYTPPVSNVMSYSPRECRHAFTDDQLSLISFVQQNSRAYLTCATPALNAFFYTVEQDTCEMGKRVAFYNASNGNPTTYTWNFGDGNTSTTESPTHTYNSVGIFTVTLTVDDGTTTDTYTEEIAVGAVSIPYTNDFELGTNSLNEFEATASLKNQVGISTAAANTGVYGVLFTGTVDDNTNFGSPGYATPTTATAFSDGWNHYFQSEMKLCVDGTNTAGIQLSFDRRQIRAFNDDYTHFRITVNGTQIGNVYQVNTPGVDDPAFTTEIVDLSAYDGTIFTIGFEATHKYAKDVLGANNTGNATFLDNLNITGTVLPVEWVAFTATPVSTPQPAVDLGWQTRTELNNDYFTVEKSADGAQWIAIEQVAGQNSPSNQLNTYQTRDITPYWGRSYYRIKQTDFDGRTSYSEIKEVSIDKPVPTFTLYPNPVTDKLTISGKGKDLQSIRLFSAQGQEIGLDQRITEINVQEVSIDLQDLPAGMYLLKTPGQSTQVMKY